MTFDSDETFENLTRNDQNFLPPRMNNTDNLNEKFTNLFLEKLAQILNIYFTPVLIVLGLFGNSISLMVFFTSKLRLQSTSQYLSALAISDILFLCQLVPPWLVAVSGSTVFSQNGCCQLIVYLSYVMCTTSSWLVVAFTIERFVAVVYPLHRNAICTVKRARLIITSLTTTSLLINLPVVLFTLPSANDCNMDKQLMGHAARFNLVDTVVSFTIPMAVIVVLNAWIIWAVYCVARARFHLTRYQNPMQESDFQRGRRYRTPQRAQQRVTKMLLIVSSTYVILNLPAYTMRIVAYANNMDDSEYKGIWASLQQVCLLMFNTNFAINFVLYCTSGQKFRSALRETFFGPHNQANISIPDQPARATIATTSFINNSTEATSSSVAGSSGTSRSGAIVQRRVDTPGMRRAAKQPKVVHLLRLNPGRHHRRRAIQHDCIAMHQNLPCGRF